MWDEPSRPSVVLRVEQRLKAADDKLEEAYTTWVHSRRMWTRFYVYTRLKKRAKKRPELEPFLDRAANRWAACKDNLKADKSEVNTYFEGQMASPKFLSAFAVHFGLVELWKLGSVGVL